MKKNQTSTVKHIGKRHNIRITAPSDIPAGTVIDFAFWYKEDGSLDYCVAYGADK